MNLLEKVLQPVRFLFSVQTGIGNKPEALSAEGEAAAAVLLPLAGLAVGLAAVLSASTAQWIGLYQASVLAALAVHLALGGGKRFSALGRLVCRDGLTAGAAAGAALALLFMYYALTEIGNMRGFNAILPALLYLPAAGSLAMVAAASVTTATEAGSMPFSGVKGLHLLLCSILAFVLMLPQFGLLSLALMAVSVLAGAGTVLVAGRKRGQGAAQAAALAAELLFLAVLMLTLRSRVYY